jgi:PUA domain protein
MADVATRLKVNLGALPTRLDVLTVDSKDRLYLSRDEPLFVQAHDDVFPTLLNSPVLACLPAITVDSGAVPHICNGANLMAPGVVGLDGEFSSGDLVAIREEKYGKILALGKTRYSSSETRERQSGVVADNVHYVGDKYWNTYKSLRAF